MITQTRQLVGTALFLALAVVLPIAFHQFGMAGRLFLPMHIPPLLAGFVFGPVSGILVGALAPSLSAVMTGMPPLYAVPLMSLELPLFGLAAGVCYQVYKLNLYVSLIIAMIMGRLGFALGLMFLGWFIDLPYGIREFFLVAVPAGLPGMIIQLIIIPPLVLGIRRLQR